MLLHRQAEIPYYVKRKVVWAFDPVTMPLYTETDEDNMITAIDKINIDYVLSNNDQLANMMMDRSHLGRLLKNSKYFHKVFVSSDGYYTLFKRLEPAVPAYAHINGKVNSYDYYNSMFIFLNR